MNKKKIMPLIMVLVITMCVSAAFAFVTVKAEKSQASDIVQNSTEQTSTITEEEKAALKTSETSHHLLDKTGTISEKQAANVNKKAQEVYDAYGVDVLILNTDGDFNYDEEDLAGHFYDINASTDAAVILLRNNGQISIHAAGRAENIFSEAELQTIYDKVTAEEKYINSFNSFVNLAGSMLKEKGVQPIPEERLLPRLVDNADLLEDYEESGLLDKLDEISERQKMDVVIVTINSLEGKTATAYADDFYDYNGYGFTKTRDGILLLVAMDDREWAISTCGSGIPTFTDEGQEYIVEQFKPDLSDGYYADAFNTFADLCDDYITQAETGEPYDYGNMPKGDFPLFRNILIALVAGVVIALIVVLVMASQLKSVKAQGNASNYTVPNSLRLTKNKDLYLYHVVTKTARPKDTGSSGGGGSSSHSSSSGSSHGGSSGSF